MPTRSALRQQRLLAAAVLLALGSLAHAQGDDAPNCPAGVFKCPKKPISWEMCTKSDLLDFYVPDLPTTGDRNSAPRDASALKVTSPDKSRYVLEGQAQIKQLDLLLRADRITYDTDTTDYSTEGHVRFQDRSMLMSAERAQGNADLDRCTLEGVQYQLLSSRGNGVAQVAVMEDADRTKLTGARYSTCDLSHQQWAFAAREMTLDRVEGVGRARNVTFRVLNVPIFWLPYMRFPLDDRRITGFLAPTIGYGSRRGLDVTLPYYLNLAPNYDATLMPRIMSQRGFMFGAEFRYLTDGSKGDFAFDYIGKDNKAEDERREYDQDIPDSRWWYRWRNSTALNANWGVGVDVNRVSDDRYFEDFGRGLYSSAISFLQSSAYLNGHGSWWNASIGGDDYQITDPTLPNQAEPYRRLPRATFTAEKAFLGDLTGGVESEFVAFGKSSFWSGPDGSRTRTRPIEGQRLDLFPYLTYPIETSAYFIRPQIGYRYTTYSLDHIAKPGEPGYNPLLKNRDPSRGTPIFSLDTGLIFERNFTFRDSGWTQTLEPRAYYLRVPYRDQNDLPLFDTQEVPFSFGQLFRSNRFVGADRQMDANNLSLALTTRFLEDATGTERLSASIGQIRYFDDQRVQLPNPDNTPRKPTDWSGSIYAAEIEVRPSDRWRVVLDQQWDPNRKETDLSTFTLQNRFGSEGVVNFSYRYRRDFLEQVDLSGLVPLSPGWRLIGRWNYALNNPNPSPLDPKGRDGRTLERFIGVEHDTCCVSWRLLMRDWIRNIEGERDKALYFELEFKGVGSIGQKTDDFLRRGILGFQ
ncbi:LPS assembly protein LptD [Dokdonella sp.]|uniref:LPS-assembly protein LptD n=1 Tax=Dokdonella sp. TaxID=2291710 RepID=UPI001B10C9DA|nr:LPS assembly protein LptD [Dokdonella sp.]MBO9663819.1 LPS assembly protein LptD [Dokdonella sp.]